MSERKKQIEEAGKRAVVSFEIPEQDVSKFRNDFRAGAEWADANQPVGPDTRCAECGARFILGHLGSCPCLSPQRLNPPAPSTSDERDNPFEPHSWGFGIWNDARKGMVSADEVERIRNEYELKCIDQLNKSAAAVAEAVSIAVREERERIWKAAMAVQYGVGFARRLSAAILSGKKAGG